MYVSENTMAFSFFEYYVQLASLEFVLVMYNEVH